MPIFEYICESCKKPFEKIVLRRDQPVECPVCGGKKYQVKFSTFAAGKSGDAPPSNGGCGCTPSSCGCN